MACSIRNDLDGMLPPMYLRGSGSLCSLGGGRALGANQIINQNQYQLTWMSYLFIISQFRKKGNRIYLVQSGVLSACAEDLQPVDGCLYLKVADNLLNDGV